MEAINSVSELAARLADDGPFHETMRDDLDTQVDKFAELEDIDVPSEVHEEVVNAMDTARYKALKDLMARSSND